ncbi:MAG: 5'-nucleotidase C-terminal domain-containing protein [Phyllobacterium sp.]
MRHTLVKAFFASSILALGAGTASADYTLNILHINDLHSRMEPINKFDSTCSAEEIEKEECFGGIARVKTKIDERRTALSRNDGNVLVLDAGDQFQGSLFYTTYKGDDSAEFMNAIGFDAMAIGNHEFDDGPEGLLRFLNKVNFPVISGNTVSETDLPIHDKYKPYVIKEIGGQKIGIVSVLATDTDETASPGPKVKFLDEIEYLKQAVADLQKEGVNKIVALNHVGYVRDQEIAAAVDGIDVIVGGHSHTLLSNTDEKALGPYPTIVKNPSGKDVPIVQAYAYSKYLGDIAVTFNDNGDVIKYEGAPILLDKTVKPDEAIAARVKELAAPLEELKARVVATTTAPIDGSRETCRARECEMGNLVADAQLDRVKDQGITLAIVNGGGLRASIGAGEVTMGDVLTVLPFQNSLATFQLKGADVITALENGASQIEEGAGRFSQVAGMKYSFDKTKPAGERITSVEIRDGDGWKAIDKDATYGVVANNYLRSGGDGYKIFATNALNAYDYGPSLEDTVAEYLAKNQPYKPYVDGRIIDVAAAQPGTGQSPATTTPDAPAPAVGQSATAPASPSPSAAADASTEQTYTIQPGDTYWDIAEKFYGDGALWRTIAKANPMQRARALHVGANLTVPEK